MKRVLIVVLISIIIPIVAVAQTDKGDTFRLFYLGGQSNMDGYGFNSELPDSLNMEFKNVYIFHGNIVGDDQNNGGLGIWETLKAGHGVGFSSNGIVNKLSDRFGVELSFVKRLQELYPNEKIAIIKYSRGGTSIDSLASYAGCWEPDYKGATGINQYDHFLATLRNANQIHDINGDGKEDILIPQGIIWMQGESDAVVTEDIAKRYYTNLTRLMNLIRAAFLIDDLPVVIGKISDSWKSEDGKVWDYAELVQYAQEKFVKEDEKAAIVRSTRYYKYSDPWHYDSEGYIDLGIKFAESVYLLNEENHKESGKKQ